LFGWASASVAAYSDTRSSKFRFRPAVNEMRVSVGPAGNHAALGSEPHYGMCATARLLEPVPS